MDGPVSNGGAMVPAASVGVTMGPGDDAPPAPTSDASRAPARPTPLTPLIQEIFLEAAANGEAIRDVCRSLNMRPGSFYRWKRMDQKFYDEFAVAMKDGLHAMDEECLVIADDKTSLPEDRKVRIHTRLQLMARRAAGTYADKLQMDVTTRNLNINVPVDPVLASNAYADLMKGRVQEG